MNEIKADSQELEQLFELPAFEKQEPCNRSKRSGCTNKAIGAKIRWATCSSCGRSEFTANYCAPCFALMVQTGAKRNWEASSSCNVCGVPGNRGWIV